MSFMNSTRARAGLLVLAMALVGGTGCITMSLVEHARTQSRQRDVEQARQQRIAQFRPRALAGEPAAMTALATAMLDTRQPDQAGAAEALAWLERAAAEGYAPAQAQLGLMRVTGHAGIGVLVPPAPGFQDRERGIGLLQRAAAQACVVRTSGASRVEPAERIGYYLRAAGRTDEAQLWRARSVVHCGSPGPSVLAARAALAPLPLPERREALALLMLRGERGRFEQAKASMTLEDAAAAERLANDLVHRIAVSERDYPAPPRKELP